MIFKSDLLNDYAGGFSIGQSYDTVELIPNKSKTANDELYLDCYDANFFPANFWNFSSNYRNHIFYKLSQRQSIKKLITNNVKIFVDNQDITHSLKQKLTVSADVSASNNTYNTVIKSYFNNIIKIAKSNHIPVDFNQERHVLTINCSNIIIKLAPVMKYKYGIQIDNYNQIQPITDQLGLLMLEYAAKNLHKLNHKLGKLS